MLNKNLIEIIYNLLTMTMKIEDLKKVLPHKTNPKGQAYIDARQVQDLLDDVCGSMNWKTEFKVILHEKDKFKRKKTDPVYGFRYIVECTLSIWDEGKSQWISKTDVGFGEDVEAEKGAYSDSFKRAAVHFGVGRFLYSIKGGSAQQAPKKTQELPKGETVSCNLCSKLLTKFTHKNHEGDDYNIFQCPDCKNPKNEKYQNSVWIKTIQKNISHDPLYEDINQ